MKKTIGLILLIGPLLIFLNIYYSNAQASDVNLANPNPIGEEVSAEQDGPPWYDSAWHYRSPVVVSNTGGTLPYYQILVKLDGENFNFDLAKADGADIRVTHSDGTTELRYWIESWDRDNQQAFLWVRVPALANGDTTIYLYYNNLDAGSTSSGTTTFDLFDDFLEFTVGPCGIIGNNTANQTTNILENTHEWSQVNDLDLKLASPWCVLNGIPSASESILTLPDGTGVRSLSTYQYKAVGFRANYGLGAGKEWAGFINGEGGQRTTIGDFKPENVDDLYLTDFVTDYEYNILPRVGGLNWHGTYHVYEIGWSAGQSTANIDHGASMASSSEPSQVPSIPLPVTLYSYMDNNANVLVDWVYIRQYRSAEPTASVGVEQGLIDLTITKEDSPDPLYAGEALTYLLTISNTSSMVDAPGVLVTDTLPTEVIFAEALPSQGNCSTTDGTVLCSLGTIPALSTASITIVVTTTLDGMISNQAYVGSPGFELDPNNNSDEVTTTVNPSADLAIDAKGYPDVLLPNGMLTYVITVTNQGPSDASDIQMVDHLPDEVEYIEAYPASCSMSGVEVTCSLGGLNRAQETQVTITTTVTTTETMNLINTATVSSSQTHDPRLINNTVETSNLVDTTVPEVTWESPVSNGDTYFTFGGIIPLEVSAQDNDQINFVKFLWYDHIPSPGHWETIGIVNNPPYLVPFFSDELVVGELYQFFAQAYDRVGNLTWEKIFIERLFPYYSFLPLIDK